MSGEGKDGQAASRDTTRTLDVQARRAHMTLTLTLESFNDIVLTSFDNDVDCGGRPAALTCLEWRSAEDGYLP